MAKLEKFIVPQYDKSGIYAIINRDKMRAYVGQSTNIKNRASQHKTKISKAQHDIEKINNDCGDEFSFLVLHRFYDENVSKDKYGKHYSYDIRVSDNKKHKNTKISVDNITHL